MICILYLFLSSTALKLQQDPEFDITDMSYDEECGNRYNYKCWKKGGHSLDKHERAHFQMHTNMAVSIMITPDAACDDSGDGKTQIKFSPAPCGATYASSIVRTNAATIPQSQVGTKSAAIVAISGGVGCTTTTAVPVGTPTVVDSTPLNSGCTTLQLNKAPVTDVVITTTALTGKKLSQVEMRGNGLHAGEKPLVGAAYASKKCYSLACHDTALGCALTPKTSSIPSVALFCVSSNIRMNYYSDAACASRIAAAASTDNGYGAAESGLAIGTKSANCYQIGGRHWWCPIDFDMAQGAC